MPDGNVNIGVTLNDNKATADLKSLKAAIEKALNPGTAQQFQKKLRETNKELRDAKDTARELKSNLNESSKQLKQNAKDIKAAEKALTAAQKEYASAQQASEKIANNERSQQIATLNQQLDDAVNESIKLGNQIEEIMSGTAKSPDVAAYEQSIKNWQKEITGYRRQLNRAVAAQQQLLSAASDRRTRATPAQYHGQFYSKEDKQQLVDLEQSIKYYNDAISENKTNIQTWRGLIQQTYADLANSPYVKQLQYDLQQYETQIEAIRTEVSSLEGEQNQELNSANVKIEEASQKIEEINAELAQLNSQTTSIQAEATQITGELDEQERLITQISQSAEITQEELDEAKAPATGLRKLFEDIGKSADYLRKRINNIVLRMLLFQTIGKAIRAFVDYVKIAMKYSDDMSHSIAVLKGNALILFQLLNAKIFPILKKIIDAIATIIGWIAKLIGLITGQSLEDARAGAIAMQDYADSINDAGKAAKKALAPFDELNIIGDSSGKEDTTIAPNFNGLGLDASGPSEFELVLGRILALVAAIAIGIAAWKLTGSIDTALILAGLFEFIYNICDMWVNGISWDNFAGALLGLTALVVGLTMAFGPVAGGIALIAGGIALIVVGVKDMIKNGPTLENQLTLIAGIGAVVIGLIATGHTTLAAIIGIIGALILVAGNFGGEWENIFKHVGEIVEGFKNLIDHLVHGDIDAAMEDLKGILRSVANLGIDLFEGLVKAIAKGINWVIEKINGVLAGISFPDWVPIVGGKSLPLIPTISTDWSLPRLAQGAVIPPNREFMAVLGDQRSGTNIETPLDTMVKAFNMALDRRGGEQITIKFTGSLAELARILKPEIDRETIRQGI